MKALVAIVTLIYSMTAVANSDFREPDKVVQSFSMHSIHGNRALEKYAELVGPVRILNVPYLRRSSLWERNALLNLLSKDWSTAKALDSPLGEEALTLPNVKVNATVLTFKKNRPIYVISDSSRLASWRQEVVSKYSEIEVFEVATIQGLRQALHDINDFEPATVLINAFSIVGDYGHILNYGTIELHVMRYRTKHEIVGVCRKGFQTPYAFGPSEQDVVNALQGNTSLSSCVKLTAVVTDTYAKTRGRYDEVGR